MAEMRRRGARSRGCAAFVQALAVGLACCAARVGAELRPQLTVTGPFDKHDHKGSRIVPYFEKTGATNIMQSFIRVSECAHQRRCRGGRLMCDRRIGFQNFLRLYRARHRHQQCGGFPVAGVEVALRCALTTPASDAVQFLARSIDFRVLHRLQQRGVRTIFVSPVPEISEKAILCTKYTQSVVGRNDVVSV